jgi:hypothetical protein
MRLAKFYRGGRIQALDLGYRLLELGTAEEAESSQLPALCVQPLLENSVAIQEEILATNPGPNIDGGFGSQLYPLPKP